MGLSYSHVGLRAGKTDQSGSQRGMWGAGGGGRGGGGVGGGGGGGMVR